MLIRYSLPIGLKTCWTRSRSADSSSLTTLSTSMGDVATERIVRGHGQRTSLRRADERLDLGAERAGRRVVIGRCDPDDHPVAPGSGGDGRRGGDVDVRLGELRRRVGDRAHTIVALDEKRPLGLAERDSRLLGCLPERRSVLRNEIDLRLATPG